ncbi:hypothetical protein SAMN05192553_10259 [Cyclobacterium xiamenense]|uniref:Uncharacterized protein n=1 Tax=Cyclobacterium xiamenense TaxID=1297121 RepID=A0A1H6VPJ4_9BACT|nr:hypothetical protein SAMN05192553_10259 [Cyclobacterium xiamenense]
MVVIINYMNSILPHNRGLREVKKRTPDGNSVYVTIAGEVVNRRLVRLKNFVLYGQLSPSNPLLHIHANRCAAYKKSQPHKQHIWFLLTQKPTLKKPKELFLVNAQFKIR